MMQFEMNSKDLKVMLDKVTSAMNRKSPLPMLTKIYLSVDEDGELKALGTDMDHWLEVRSKLVYYTAPGKLGIDLEDLKAITKMNGNIIMAEDDDCVNVICGKKTVSIPKYTEEFLEIPTLNDDESKWVIMAKENWLLDTLTRLSVFLKKEDSNKCMESFHIHTKQWKIEALNGVCIGERDLRNQGVQSDLGDTYGDIMLHGKCVPVMKKVLNKRSEDLITMGIDKKHIEIYGEDFIYVIRRVEGVYFNTDKLWGMNDYIFNVEKESIVEALKYDCDLNGRDSMGCPLPVFIKFYKGNLYMYYNTGRNEVLDVLNLEENYAREDLVYAFNPHYLLDVFSMVDVDVPECKGSGCYAPFIIMGDEYNFLVVPVRPPKGADFIEKMNKKLQKVA